MLYAKLANNKSFKLLLNVNTITQKRKEKMIKLQTHSQIINSKAKVADNMALMDKNHFGHAASSGTECSSSSFKTNHDVLEHDQFKLSKSMNKFDKKTAKTISFSGLSVSKGAELLEKLNKTGVNKVANNKYWLSFWKKAKENQTVFDAMFALLITCGLRPAAILAQSNDQNRKKNEKAASHSISSGLIGFGLALAIFNPIKTGLDKLGGNPEKYMKKAEKWFTFGGKKLLQNSQRLETFKVLVNQGSQAFVAKGRSLITIAMIPIIDRLVLNRIFKTDIPPATKAELKKEPTYSYSYINFKNSQQAKNVFQNFSGVMK